MTKPATPRHLILHIGGRKTGSTALQSVMKRNRAALRRQGILIPTSLRQKKRTEDFALPRFFLGHPEWEPNVREFLAESAEHFATGGSTVHVSSEALTDLDRNELGSLRRTLAPGFDRFTVVFVVRRQDIVATSHFSTRLTGPRRGETADRMSRRMGSRGARPFQYGSIVNDWTRTFPEAAFRCIRYVERHQDSGWDLYAAYFRALGIATDGLDMSTSKRNAALTAEAAAHIRLANMKQAAGELPGDFDFIRDLQSRFIAAFPIGERVWPSRADAQAFFASFAEENELLRRLAFPELPAVFDDDFSQYPEKETDFDALVDAELFARLVAETLDARAGA